MKTWSPYTSYQKGDRAWYHSGGESYYLYKCDQTKCVGGSESEPSYNGKVWKFVGNCKSNPS